MQNAIARMVELSVAIGMTRGLAADFPTFGRAVVADFRDLALMRHRRHRCRIGHGDERKQHRATD